MRLFRSIPSVLATSLLALCALTAQAQAPAQAPAGAGFNPAASERDRAVIDAAIADYLKRNPQVVREALVALEERERLERERQARAAIEINAEQLLRDATSPVGGNPRGDVTVVEFFDYRCPHCRRASPIVDELIASDKNVRVVYKEFPILGPDSVLAARSALAAHRQGRYDAFHKAMMEAEDFSIGATEAVATRLGLDVARFRADRDGQAVGSVIDASFALAGALGINGTPSFVVGTQLMPGAVPLPVLQEAVATLRREAAAKR